MDALQFLYSLDISEEKFLMHFWDCWNRLKVLLNACLWLLEEYIFIVQTLYF